MLHIMVDAYQANADDLADLRMVYEKIYKVTNHMQVETIMPPMLVPYYYGRVKEDDGISAFVLLKGGHFTIHTFPERECYFVDMLYDGFINEDKLLEVLSVEFPFGSKIVNAVDRRFALAPQTSGNYINEFEDFGPHYMIKTLEPIDFGMDRIYQFLDQLPCRINMDPISRPLVITDHVTEPTLYSGLTVIAQSHIAFHYYIETGMAYIDVFSCSFINCANFIKEIERELGVECEIVLISRGSKHVKKLAIRDEVIERYNAWQSNIQ